MKVVDSEHHCWFLFEHHGELLLDVNCELNAFGYSFMIKLNEAERMSYEFGGHDYLSKLAREIGDSVPITANTTSIYKGRRVPDQISKLATDAAKVWRENSGLS